MIETGMLALSSGQLTHLVCRSLLLAILFILLLLLYPLLLLYLLLLLYPLL